jgi:probable rRNA maturation factor
MKLHLSQQIVLSEPAASELSRTLPRSTVRGWVLKALAVDADSLSNVYLTLRWVDEPEGRELNRTHRSMTESGIDKDYATNVLTFAYGTEEGLDDAGQPTNEMSADIVLCWPVLLHEAKAQHKSVRHHAAHLIIHGVLHALGFDHEVNDEAEAMEALETKLLAELNIANPYLEV